ncbi:hypothetical protein Syun_013221 [Stephania yunnanensis]|uniref:Homeobox domain-containing protein n=1 Tax=Stephania yunnanensis TaxID=152371 RepID=A0AAP0K0Y9_9MAGN
MESDPELFNLTTSVELLSLPSKPSSTSSSWKMFHGPNNHFYRTTQITKPEFQPVFSEAECSSINPKQHQRDSGFALSNFKDGFFESSKFSADLQHQHISQDGFLGKAPNFHGQQGKQQHHTQIELKNSKYLAPTQELLSEFCSLRADPPMQKKNNQWRNDETAGATKSSLINSLDLVELHKRQANLFSMLKEVDQRYRLYCDQIKGVVSSFETVLGEGAATVYSKPASQAMSRHFRCLRDGIMYQIKEIKEVMGENSAPLVGLNTRLDCKDINKKTPKLRLIDQSLRKQKSFQQMSILERQPWRPQRGLPERSVTVLRAWLFEHFLHPYPSDVDKMILARQAGLSRSQVSNWFINARVRLWKPMVEEMYLEETKDQNYNNMPISTDTIFRDDETTDDDNSPTHQLHYHNNRPPPTSLDDHTETILSIINKDHDSEHEPPRHHHQQHPEMAVGGIFGLDHLESYEHHSPGMLPFAGEGMHQQNYRNSVSLTLGLQQHGGDAAKLSLSPASHHSSSFVFPKDHGIEDCQPVQYSI